MSALGLVSKTSFRLVPAALLPPVYACSRRNGCKTCHWLYSTFSEFLFIYFQFNKAVPDKGFGSLQLRVRLYIILFGDVILPIFINCSVTISACCFHAVGRTRRFSSCCISTPRVSNEPQRSKVVHYRVLPSGLLEMQCANSGSYMSQYHAMVLRFALVFSPCETARTVHRTISWVYGNMPIPAFFSYIDPPDLSEEAK